MFNERNENIKYWTDDNNVVFIEKNYYKDNSYISREIPRHNLVHVIYPLKYFLYISEDNSENNCTYILQKEIYYSKYGDYYLKNRNILCKY